jgi:hypothetical protein
MKPDVLSMILSLLNSEEIIERVLHAFLTYLHDEGLLGIASNHIDILQTDPTIAGRHDKALSGY